MKYLSNYVEEAQTKLFDECGAFFAFSRKQLNKKLVKGTKYFDLGNGLFCPQDTTTKLTEGLRVTMEEGIKQDLQENGQKGVILRELGNYECQITYDIDNVVSTLESYKITEAQIKEVWPEFLELCDKNGWY